MADDNEISTRNFGKFFCDQWELLNDSSAAYDSGKLIEAPRISQAAFLLVADRGRNQVSLLSRLGLKTSVSMISSVQIDRPSFLLPLAGIHADVLGDVAYVPILDSCRQRRELSFDDWWQEPVYVTASHETLTREELVMTMRDKDWGGHGDSVISNVIYNTLRDVGAPHVTYSRYDGGIALFTGSERFDVVAEVPLLGSSQPVIDPTSARFVENGLNASIRQIAWELDYSFRHSGLLSLC